MRVDRTVVSAAGDRSQGFTRRQRLRTVQPACSPGSSFALHTTTPQIPRFARSSWLVESDVTGFRVVTPGPAERTIEAARSS